MSRPHATVDSAASIPMFGMQGRRHRIAIEDAFAALAAAVYQAGKDLDRRPRQLDELDRAVSRLYEVLMVAIAPGQPSVMSLLERYGRQLDQLERLSATVNELEARVLELEGERSVPMRAAGGAR